MGSGTWIRKTGGRDIGRGHYKECEWDSSKKVSTESVPTPFETQHLVSQENFRRMKTCIVPWMQGDEMVTGMDSLTE